MEAENLQKLKEGIKSNVEKYDKVDINDPSKAKILKIITSETELVNKNDALITETNLKNQRFNFEKDKFKQEKELDDKRHSLEETKVKNQKTIEEKKIKLEKSKLTAQGTIEQNRLDFEKDKLKQQKELEDSKNKYLNSLEIEKAKIEQQKLDIEIKRLNIEELKYQKEIEQFGYDEKRNKKEIIINTMIRVLEISLPLAINAWLVLMQFRLVYKDDGRIPSEMKDLLKNVYRGK